MRQSGLIRLRVSTSTSHRTQQPARRPTDIHQLTRIWRCFTEPAIIIISAITCDLMQRHEDNLLLIILKCILAGSGTKPDLCWAATAMYVGLRGNSHCAEGHLGYWEAKDAYSSVDSSIHDDASLVLLNVLCTTSASVSIIDLRRRRTEICISQQRGQFLGSKLGSHVM